MRVGTPGFSGSRLREAREARNLSVIDLSDLTGVTRQAIYSYETDKSSPSADVLAKLAAATNMPEAFLLRPEREADERITYFRSMASTTKTERRRAERRMGWLEDITEYLSAYVDLPQLRLPVVDIPDDFMLLSDQDIEDATDAVREQWRLGPGPISNMVVLLENHGVVVGRDELQADTLDGLSRCSADSKRGFVFIATDKGSPARWRFDAAHELGHLLLHGSLRPEQLTRTEQFRKIEQQAHRFAAALLLPLAPFGEDLFGVNLDTLRSIKPKWNVSIAMMIRRARDADLINSDEQRRLWIQMSRRRWRTEEPFDRSTGIEEPRLLRRSFEMLLESGQQSASDVTAKLALPASDIESLAFLPKGFFSDYAPVSLLTPNPTQDSSDLATRSGRVIHFPRR